MVVGAAHRVVEYLSDRIDDDLRAVIIVREDNHTVAHLNDDLRQRYSPDTLSKVVDTFRLREPLFAPDIEGDPIGERRAVVHYHEQAFVLQIPFSETETILISVSRDVGRDLLGFIEECRQLVADAA